ncbi:MAG: hypothetical protein ABH832_01845 [bacterium]
MEQQEHLKLKPEQKIGFFLLLVFGTLSLGLGVLHIRNTMYRPFALNNSVPPLSTTITQDQSHLRFRDTDNDAVNDFDELYVYKTSPYLADTDSDGITDGQEINNNSDPLCPQGQSCSNFNANVSIAPTSSSYAISALGEPPTTTLPLDLNSALSDPQQVRQLLLSAGMDPSALSAISDVDLMASVSSIMQSNSLNSMINANNATNTHTTSTS